MRIRITGWMVLALLALSCAGPQESGASAKPDDAVATVLGSHIRLVEGDDARVVLAQSDVYTQSMGDFERSLRTRTAEPATEADYLASGAASVVPWEPEAKTSWAEAARQLAEAVEGLELELPDEILVIRTKADFDVGLPHTKGAGIILTSPLESEPLGLLAHELFHVASRHDPALRDRLFPLFGFRITEPVEVPDSIAERRLTNPDAHDFQHAINVTTTDGDVEVVPMLQVAVPLEEALAAGNVFSVMQINLVAIDGSAIYDAQETNFAEVMGINTGYIIHPEEVVADNFALLCLRRAGAGKDVPHPEYLDKMEAELSGS